MAREEKEGELKRGRKRKREENRRTNEREDAQRSHKWRIWNPFFYSFFPQVVLHLFFFCLTVTRHLILFAI